MTKSTREVDVLVVGGGVIGAAAALAASSRRGSRVALVERHPFLGSMGSSKGAVRIYAPAPFPDTAHLRMALAALERWRRLEKDRGEELLERTGALSMGAFAEQALDPLLAEDVDAELVPAEEALERFGLTVRDGAPLLHQTDAGTIRAERARLALIEAAREAGAALHQNTRVRSLRLAGDRLEVDTGRGLWRCERAILAAGPWNAQLAAQIGIELEQSVSLQSVAYFATERPAGQSPAPLMDFEGSEPFACWDPERGLKAAFHARGAEVPDPDRPGRPDDGEIERIGRWLGDRYPRLRLGSPLVEPCMYTNTPNEEFALERRGPVIVASACNGQGFQFAPETGERLARLAFDEVPVASGTTA